MICEHPECTGRHNWGLPISAICPDAARRRRDYQRQWRQEHRDSDREYSRRWRERNPGHSRRRYLERRKPKYVYAMLVGTSALKIGCSTAAYIDQKWHTARSFRERGFGEATPSNVHMIWHNRGDEGLEVFLQWRAGRLWRPLAKGSRHSEWFDVTGVSPDEIRKNLRRWRDQAELPDEESD